MLPTSDHPVFKYVNLVRQAQATRDAQVLNDVTRMYARSYSKLKADIDAMLKVIKETGANKDEMLRLSVTRNLLEGVKSEMNDFANLLGDKIESTIAREIAEANISSLGMVQMMLPGISARLAGTWAKIAPDQVYTMYGFLSPNGALYSRLKANFGTALADRLKDSLMDGFVTGMNPRAIARMISNSLGTGLNWAMTTTRTANLWAYRTASHLNYQRNSDVVKGWTWFAQLDDRCCMSCVAMHGTQHRLDEILDDHHAGRCTALPTTASYAELGFPGMSDIDMSVTTGKDWFNSLSESRQRSMMGPGVYNSWKNNMFEFDKLSRVYNDPVYGIMRGESSLKALLGDKAKLFYGHEGD